MEKHVIVTDGLWRKSISAIRSLGKAGYSVCVTGDSYLTTGFWSRYAKKRYKLPDAAADKEKFGNRLTSLLMSYAEKGIKPVLVPMEDETVLWCSENRAAVSKYAYISLPSHESLVTAQDKMKTLKIAESIGVSCPKTWYPETCDEFFSVLSAVDENIVIKPAVGRGSVGLLYGKTHDGLDLSLHWEKYGALVVQERLPEEGRGLGVCLAMDENHECVAAFAHVRIKQYPITGGPSTIRKGIFDKTLIDESIRLLEALDWVGVAMVEWKEAAPGVPKLMEINPRFWGSLELSIRSGVDFPVIYARLAEGLKVLPVLVYNIDVICRWLIPGDILRFIAEGKGRREKLSEFLRGSLRNSEEWDRSDIRGFFANIICQGLKVLNPKYWKYLRR